jgi:hypothetical protein
MFRGSIPADMQRILAETTAGWNGKGQPLYIGCSGNLTIERTIFRQGWKLHGNDVLMYTSALGSFWAGKPLDFRLSDEAKVEFPWVADYESTDLDRLATMMLLSRMVEVLGKTNRYYARLRKANEDQWPRMHAATKARLEAVDMKLASFTPEDVFTWIDRVPKDAPVVMYPPFVGADTAFQKDFANLERMFVWPGKPTFGELKQEHLTALYEKIMDRPLWLMGINVRLPQIEEHRVAMTQTTNRGVPIHVYSSKAPTRIVVPRQITQQFTAPHLKAGERIGERISLAVLSEAQFSALRSKYMNPHIRPGASSLALAVLVDGKLIGVFAFSFAPTPANWDSHLDGPHAYLLSDFPVSGTSYRHLAKLVLYASLSTEAKALAERYARKRWRAYTTTAYSKRPVSMKYRGVLKLLKRLENDALDKAWARDIDSSDAYYSQPYQLQYGGVMGQWSLAEGFEIWKQRSGVFDDGAEARADQD